MEKLTINVKVVGFDKIRASLHPSIAERATRLAINDIAKQVRTAAQRQILAKWNVKAGKIKLELKNVKFATKSDHSAIIQAKGRPISLRYFEALEIRRVVKGKGGRYRQVKGVTVNILRNIKVSYRGVFKATMANQYRGVFRAIEDSYHTPTRGKYAGKRGRTKIVSMASISIASMFNQIKVQQELDSLVTAKFPPRWNHHMDRLGG